MSVINQVLRDLDARRAPALAPAGTVPVAPTQSPPRGVSRVVLWMGILAGLVLFVAGGYFALRGSHSGTKAEAPATAASTPAPVDLHPTVSVMPSVARVPLPEAVQLAAPMRVASAPTSVLAGKFESAMTLRREAPPSVVATDPGSPARLDVERKQPPVEPMVVADNGQRQQQAGRDTLAQAQTLWNSGARDAAVELLQQAMESAQRNATGATPATNSPVLGLLVREWCRMQLAEGRVGKVWETLTRLEPQLRNETDLWAVRANAAQRLGHHQDSVHAYMVALESRPTEQRWLLGAAVSLAALGQTESASAMAEKGRAAGPISSDVQTYLRQMGVQLKD